MYITLFLHVYYIIHIYISVYYIVCILYYLYMYIIVYIYIYMYIILYVYYIFYICILYCVLFYVYYITVSARIIERSQEDKSTVKYRTFVLLRVPIRSGVGKFNYRTGRRTKVRYFTVLFVLLAPFYNFWHWHDIYCIFVHIQSIKWRFNEDLMRIWWGNEDKMQIKWRFDEETRIKWG